MTNLPSLNGNWVDLTILIVLIYFTADAARKGIWIILLDFASFLASLLISLRAYKFMASLLRSNFSLSNSLANALGFLISAIVLESLIDILLNKLVRFLPKKLWKVKWPNILAIIPGLGEGILVIAFILTLIIGLPIKPQIKDAVSDSKIGSYILNKTSGIEKYVNDIFGGVVQDSLTYLTVEPGADQSVSLNIARENLTVDVKAEAEMFALVNEERSKRGVAKLVWDSDIVLVARAHARDMWKRKYFSHYSPEGKDVGARLDEAGRKYTIAGENLALAPTVDTAHRGLMNSEGHRANILESEFHKIGIGVIDNGYYGKMFVQVFTD